MFAALVIATSIALSHLPAEAGTLVVPNLTGTWTGKFLCSGLGTSLPFAAEFKFLDKEATLELNQTDDDLAARLIASDPDFGMVVVTTNMCGTVVGHPEKPNIGRAGLVAPALSVGSAFAVEFQSAKISPPNGKGISGKLKGKGLIVQSGLSSTSAGCTWTFERIDETAPADPPACDDICEPPPV